MCVCVCVCVREREREKEREFFLCCWQSAKFNASLKVADDIIQYVTMSVKGAIKNDLRTI